LHPEEPRARAVRRRRPAGRAHRRGALQVREDGTRGEDSAVQEDEASHHAPTHRPPGHSEAEADQGPERQRGLARLAACETGKRCTTTGMRIAAAAIAAAAAVLGAGAGPARVAVLGQIALPHNYYYRELYLPQLTSGPSSVAWTPDGGTLVYSMQGSLWSQPAEGGPARQLTDEPGTDYQPDVSPDGRSVVFVRYDGRSMELMLLDRERSTVRALTSSGAVNVEPRWSPDGRQLAFVSTEGTGHFLLHVADVREGRLAARRVITADRRSAIARYYYSPFDHAINPAWSRNGKDLVFVSNREIAHGSGDIVRAAADGSGEARVLQHEETSWHARPDVSPDGTRIVYSSYLGRQWQQL